MKSPIVMGGGMRIDNSHDIPSGANSSRSTIYIDRSIPQFSKRVKDKNGRPANLWKYLSVHETHEAKHMAAGVDYAKAHKLATAGEKAHVERDGVSWKEYTHEMNGYLSHTEKKKAPPPEKMHAPDGKGCYRNR